jgi:hypothetical protein
MEDVLNSAEDAPGTFIDESIGSTGKVEKLEDNATATKQGRFFIKKETQPRNWKKIHPSKLENELALELAQKKVPEASLEEKLVENS